MTSAAPTANTAMAMICGSHGRSVPQATRTPPALAASGRRRPEAAAISTDSSSGTT